MKSCISTFSYLLESLFQLTALLLFHIPLPLSEKSDFHLVTSGRVQSIIIIGLGSEESSSKPKHTRYATGRITNLEASFLSRSSLLKAGGQPVT